jgi:hypothetical protein
MLERSEKRLTVTLADKGGKIMKRLVIAALAGVMFLSGCATVTRGRTETWTVSSSPSGAAVRTTAGFQCESTPCSFTIRRKSKFDVTVSKDGYQTFTGKVDNKISGRGGAGMAGNVLAGGLIGIGVDAATGSALDVYPNPMRVILEPTSSSASSRLDEVPEATPAPAKP